MRPVILIVDAESQTFEDLSDLFRDEAYDLIHAESADAGRELLEQREADIIVGDADCGSTELLIEAAQRWPRAWRILLVSEPDLSLVFEAFEDHGVDAMLTKPRSAEQLAREIEEALMAVAPRNEPEDDDAPPVITLDPDDASADIDDLLDELRTALEKRPAAE